LKILKYKDDNGVLVNLYGQNVLYPSLYLKFNALELLSSVARTLENFSCTNISTSMSQSYLNPPNSQNFTEKGRERQKLVPL